MQKFFFLFGLVLFGQSGLFAQCLSLPVCPTTSPTFCDSTENNAYYWNDSTFYNASTTIYNLGEALTDLSMQSMDSCDTSDVKVSFVLLLDLDGYGVRETAIFSDSLPEAGLVYYGNASNPNYTGGQPTLFDKRPVPNNQKYKFVLERVEQGGLITVRVRWANAFAPNDYIIPELPIGNHRIEWRFEKNGEIQICNYNFIIKDCRPPAISCVGTFTVNIPEVQFIELVPSNFLQSAQDNVTPTARLQYAMRRSATGTGFPVNNNGQAITSVGFTCSDLGLQSIELWVRDLAGNAAYCETSIIIQDNLGNCIGNPSLGACAINHCNGAPVPYVDFELTGSVPGVPPFSFFQSSDSTGCVSFDGNIPVAGNTKVTPTKNGNPLEGINTLDLMLIYRDILGVEALDSPYKRFAADINASGSVTGFDVLELRKLIVGIYEELPYGNSWRFIDTSFVFPNPSNPFPPTVTPPNTFPKVFYGIKIGDVDCSALQPFSETPEEDVLIIPDLQLQANDTVEIPIHFLQTESWYGFQFGLQFDSTKIEILEVLPLSGDTGDSFGIFSDHVNITWFSWHSIPMGHNQLAVRLKIKSLVPLQLSDIFSVSSGSLHPEVYPEIDSLVRLSLQFSTVPTTEPNNKLQILDPSPNPTTAGVHIPLQLEQPETVKVEVLDLTGRVMYQQQQLVGNGAQLMQLPATAFPQTGLYIWRVQAGTAFRSGKIIRQ